MVMVMVGKGMGMTELARQGKVEKGKARYCMVWDCMGWYSIVLYSTVWYSIGSVLVQLWVSWAAAASTNPQMDP